MSIGNTSSNGGFSIVMLVFGGKRFKHIHEFFAGFFKTLLYYVEIFINSSRERKGHETLETWLSNLGMSIKLDTNNGLFNSRVLGDFHDVMCHREVCHGSIAVPKDLTWWMWWSLVVTTSI